MSKRSLTKESILKALEASKATSVSALYRAMGGGNSIPGSTARRIRSLVPDIGERLETNKSGKPNAKESIEPKSRAATRHSSPYPRHPANRYREGSSYALAFDILAAHPSGLSRQRLLEMYAKASGATQDRARFNLAVVLSPRESATGPRHRSAREGYWIEMQNNFVRLRTA